MAAVKISVSIPPDVLASIDRARGDLPRSTFIAAAARAVAEMRVKPSISGVQAVTQQIGPGQVVGAPGAQPGPDGDALRRVASSAAKAGVRPIPKGGKR